MVSYANRASDPTWSLLFIGIVMVSVSETRHPDPGLISIQVHLRLLGWRRRCQSTSRPASHLLVYALMFAAAAGRLDNTVGGRISISLVGSVHLSPPVGVDPALFALLRRPRTLLGLSIS
jgi:hypothetical protein